MDRILTPQIRKFSGSLFSLDATPSVEHKLAENINARAGPFNSRILQPLLTATIELL